MNLQWVREWRCRHSLPVVAIGSIPYICRRVGFRLRATPAGDAYPASAAPILDRVNRPVGVRPPFFDMAWPEPFSCPAKALQSHQPESRKLLQAHPAVVMVAEMLVFHAAQAPPNPRVQFPKPPPASGPARSEVVGCALNNSVEFLDKLRVQVVRAASQFPHLVFELVLGLGTHTFGPARNHKPQEGVTLAVGRDTSFLGAQLESELVEDDVGQQWAGDAPLGRADRGGLEHAVFHHACAKEFLDEVEDVAVGDLSRDCFLDKRMGQVIKTADDVSIENNSIAFIVMFHGQHQGLMAVASWTEAKGRLVKQRLEDRV